MLGRGWLISHKTPLKTNECPLKIKRLIQMHFLLKSSLFRGHVTRMSQEDRKWLVKGL